MSSMIGYGAKAPKGYSSYSMPTMGPEGQDLWKLIYGNMKGGLGQGIGDTGRLAAGDESMFQQLEKPAYSAFQQGLGQLGSRFSQMAPGAMSSQNSSGFNLAGSAMAQDLGERLQSQRLGLQQQAIRDLMGMSQSLLHTPTQQYGLAQKAPGMWEQLLGGLGGAAGQAMGIGGGMLGGSWLSGSGRFTPKSGMMG